MLKGNHYLRLRKPNQPQMRLVTDSPDKDQYLNDFIWVSGQWEFLADEPDLFSIPRHRGYIPVGENQHDSTCDTFYRLDYVIQELTKYFIWFALVEFNRRFWRRSDRCSAAISAVNNFGRFRYTIPIRATR